MCDHFFPFGIPGVISGPVEDIGSKLLSRSPGQNVHSDRQLVLNKKLLVIFPFTPGFGYSSHSRKEETPGQSYLLSSLFLNSIGLSPSSQALPMASRGFIIVKRPPKKCIKKLGYSWRVLASSKTDVACLCPFSRPAESTAPNVFSSPRVRAAEARLSGIGVGHPLGELLAQ